MIAENMKILIVRVRICKQAGSIETKDGKDLFIRIIGESSNNFGELPFRKGESFTLSVRTEEESSLEIGIMSISIKLSLSKAIEGPIV